MLTNTSRQLNANVRRARYMANLSPERWARAVAEHEQMLAALDARDSAQLTGLLNQHLGNKLLSVLEVLDVPSAQAAAPTDSPTQQKN